MKILDIKLNNEVDSQMKLKSGLKLYPVTITVKKWFRKPKTINCYPTNYGPTCWSDSILFFYYVDDEGKELSDSISQQINNWCRVQTMKDK